jgi:(p)ppGpp synthase/HD superfamily hydrolase
MTSIEKAIAMAVSAHADQRDKEGASYILHPLRIAMNFVGAEHLFCIAMLHDVVEDTLSEENEITIADVEREFGKEVSVSVDCLTRRPKERYLEEYIPRVARDK